MGRVGTLETAIIDGGNMDAEDEVIVAEEVASVVEGITGGGGWEVKREVASVGEQVTGER